MRPSSALLSCLLCSLLFTALGASAQPARPIPYPVIPPPQFEQAVANGTRTRTGEPGPNYWTNTAEYRLAAVLSPETRMLRGNANIRYHNRAPQALAYLYVHLRQNLHRAGAVRNRFAQVTGGMHIADVEVDGHVLRESTTGAPTSYSIQGTVMRINLPEPLPSGGTVELSLSWSFEVPAAGAPRMGQDEEVFFLAYWYPQIAAYDDVNGWTADQYMGNGEFYMGYGTYDVRITVPQGWLVAATGVLQNPEAVFTPETRARLERVEHTTEIVSIVAPEERGKATRTSPSGQLTWHYRAEDVRDFAFGASDRYVWDATTADAGDHDGDGRRDRALIHSLYRPDRAAWNRSAEFARFSIEYLSDLLIPYPYPHMTAVEGVIGGGMEFPMITHIGGSRTDQSLFSVTFHEISHMWFPMIVGQNEKRYAWMDEGLTSFNTTEATAAFFNTDAWHPSRQSYYSIANSGREVELMRHADEYPFGTSARVIASYNKPAVALHALRGLFGNERFLEAYRTYARRWTYKHPLPYDLFNTFEAVLGEDLDWFWTALFYETWTLDHAIGDVAATSEGVTVTVEDRGLTLMPALIRVTYADGQVAERRVPVSHWLEGARTFEARFEPGRVVRVELDPARFLPDVARQNNTWMP